MSWKFARRILAAVAALAVVAMIYLSWRVVEARRSAPESVAAILRDADPRLAAIPERRLAMLVRVEDPTFWSHSGLDFSTPGAGNTTLSQAVGKIIFFDDFSPGLPKLELMAVTRFGLIPTVAKRDILHAFLAMAYLGRDARGPITGFAEGARRWYGKEIDQLSDREFLGLVAMLPAPSRLNPRRDPAAHAARIVRIERLLAGACRPDGLSDVALEGCAA
ncbi:MAG: transglycosylase domain-containing protein [Allosphingosinicella sp.]